MRIFIVCAIGALFTSPAFGADFEFEEAIAKERCQTQFPGDFFMIKSCIDLERDSAARIPILLESVPADVATTIATKCASMAFGMNSLFLKAGCIDLQIESWRSLNQ